MYIRPSLLIGMFKTSISSLIFRFLKSSVSEECSLQSLSVRVGVRPPPSEDLGSIPSGCFCSIQHTLENRGDGPSGCVPATLQETYLQFPASSFCLGSEVATAILGGVKQRMRALSRSLFLIYTKVNEIKSPFMTIVLSNSSGNPVILAFNVLKLCC